MVAIAIPLKALPELCAFCCDERCAFCMTDGAGKNRSRKENEEGEGRFMALPIVNERSSSTR